MSDAAFPGWSEGDLAAILAPLGARWLRAPATGVRVLPAGVSIDSRKVPAGGLFVAIAGERVNGNDFLDAAFAAGAAAAIADHPDRAAAARGPVLLVSSARRALALLAADYRRRLAGTRVIAIAGSNGKTTTTRLLAAALSAAWPGHWPEKSFNNDLGVPLTILACPPAARFLLCEVGSNAPGEVAALGAIVRPDAAVIVSIGREHLEGFGSLAGVAAEEASIAAALAPGGRLIATADSPELAAALAALALPARGVQTTTFGLAPHADLRPAAIDLGPAGQHVTLADGTAFTLPLLGEHNAVNALAALAVGRWLGLPDATLAAGLATARPAEMRLERSTIAGVDVLNDAYNANPESTLAALRTFVALHPRAPLGGRRIVVLGDHLEQGPGGPAVHEELGRAIAAHAAAGRLDALITVGPLAALAGVAARAGGLADIYGVPSTADPHAAAAAARINPGDAVLLKGSRGTRLERLADALRARAATDIATPSGSGHAVPAV